MNFFSKNKKNKLQITSSDREWVEGNFQWLVKVFGCPKTEQLSLSVKDFPRTFESKEIKIENLIDDCCSHLGLDKSLFSYEIYEDIRDSVNIPYAFAERPVDCFIDYNETTGKYSVVLAKSILRHPNWLIVSICYEFSKVRLIESKVEFDTGVDTNLFLYLAAVYFGYGVIIGQNLTDVGRSMVAMWETKWSYVADIPYPVIAYTLAIFAKLKNDLHPSWKEQLPNEIQIEFDLAIEYLINSKNELFDATRIDNALNVKRLIVFAHQLYESGELEKAITTLQKISFLTDNRIYKAGVYNNIGYYKLRLGKYQSSISDFLKAIKLDPNYGYANDNLGFALIMSGDLDKGKEYLEKALQTDNNDNAYSYRNMALYFQKKGDNESAENYFQKAFDQHSPVDLLDYFYGCFHLEKGDKEKGLEHIQISSDIGEHEGIELLNKMKNN
jgi:Tfp pilus assembly protein PilF